MSGQPSPADFATCVVSFSSGKDSAAALGIVLRELRWPPARVYAHLQVLPEQWTWWDLPYMQDLCRRWGVGFAAEQVVYEPALSPRSQRPETGVRTARVAPVATLADVHPTASATHVGGLVGLALRRGLPPTRRYRYCTSYLKERPLNHWIRRHRAQLGSPVAVVLGTRAAESPSRRGTPALRERHGVSAPSLVSEVWDAHPVLDWSRRDVFRCLQRLDVEPHPAYRLLGLSGPQVYEADEEGGPRVSCLTCIFAQDEHLLAAAADERAGPALAQVCGYEVLTGRTWRQAGAVVPVLARAGRHAIVRQGDELAREWERLTWFQPTAPLPRQWEQPTLFQEEQQMVSQRGERGGGR